MPPTSVPAKGKRQRLLEWVQRRRLSPLLRPVHDRGRRSLLVLAYHRVVANADLARYPLDVDLVSASAEDFRWQMSYLCSHAEPVSLDTVAEHLEHPERLPKRAVVVTIDDGSYDAYDHAFPVLRDHGVPATVFPVTGNLDTGEPFWFEFVAHLMMSLPAGAIAFDALRLPVGESLADRRVSTQRLHEALKLLPNERRCALVRQWRDAFSGRADAQVERLLRPMTWAQVGEMARAGVGFGSHSVSHPNLTRVSDSQLDWELSESRRLLSQHTGLPVNTLAYPIGTADAFDDRVIAATRRAGYRLAVSYLSGVNWHGDFAPFALRRQGITLATTRSYFRALLDLPAWFR